MNLIATTAESKTADSDIASMVLVAPPAASVPDRVAFREALNAVSEECRLTAATSAVVLADSALKWRIDVTEPVPFAVLGLTLADATRRDEIVYTWGWGRGHGDRVVQLGQLLAECPQLRYGATFNNPADEALLRELIGRGGGPRPDSVRLVRAQAVLERLCALAADEVEVLVPALTVLAWTHWALGDLVEAELLCTHVRQIAPEYHLAVLLGVVLDRDLVPDWLESTAQAA